MNYLTAEEAAEYLGVTRSTLYAYVSRGLIESVDDDADGRRRRYRKSDLSRLRRRGEAASGEGPKAGDALHWGRPSLETDVGSIEPRGPKYRGKALRAMLREGWSYSQVSAWLWGDGDGTWMVRGEDFRAAVDGIGDVFGRIQEKWHPFDAMRFAALEVGRRGGVQDGEESLASPKAVWRRVMAAVPTIFESTVSAELVTPARLVMVSVMEPAAVSELGEETDSVVRLIDTVMSVSAEHGLNASTFAGRVAASTGASLADAMTASLAAFSGNRHGFRSERVREMVSHWRDSGQTAGSFVRERMENKADVPGFGHPLYEHGDPRFGFIRDRVLELFGEAETVRAYDEFCGAAEASGLPAPNLDMGLAMVADVLGLQPSRMPFVFAAGRAAGWLAHAVEQRARDEVLRPRGSGG